jgi:hypothetical protein
VTGAKVKDGSLHTGDFAAGESPAGATGLEGPKGAPGRSALETLQTSESIHGVWGVRGNNADRFEISAAERDSLVRDAKRSIDERSKSHPEEVTPHPDAGSRTPGPE